MTVRVLTVISLLLLASVPLSAQSVTTNTSSCDIGVTPAATLLLPYFEVDPAGGANTLFTVTNTSRYPQIAHVTLWTDWAFPVLSFDIFLTGYDVQGVSLFDVIARGQLVPTTNQIDPGSPAPKDLGGHAPLGNASNPNFVVDGSTRDVRTSCRALPASLPAEIAAAVKSALTAGAGSSACGTTQVGFNHGTVARGYATIDVVSYCGATMLMTDPLSSYYAGPDSPLLFDNVLLGDYQQVGMTPAGTAAAPLFDAGGGPMVHIRAIPEGGRSGASGGTPVATNLPFTFYDRYTPSGARTADRRQPLPTVWAARFIQGGPNGFATDFKIWREGVSGATSSCTAVQDNRELVVRNMVRYDEHDNAFGLFFAFAFEGCCPPPVLPAVSRLQSFNYVLPLMTGSDVGGWMYFDLNSDSQSGYGIPHKTLSAQRDGFNTLFAGTPLGSSGSRTQTQAWVSSSMFGAVGANRLSVDFDAAWLGNGCSRDRFVGSPIGPLNHAGGALVCPSNDGSGCSPLTRPAEVNP